MSTDLHTLTGAYALDALEPDEAHDFDTHIDTCPECRQEVREFQDVVARMGFSEALRAPAHLKARVLSAADRLSQLPPVVVPMANEPADGSERRTTSRLPRLLAAAAVVLIAAGGIAVNQVNQEPESNLAAGVTAIFEAEDASTDTVRTRNGGTISVATSDSLGRMAVDTDALPELGTDKVYQLWTIDAGAVESAGLLDDPNTGAAMTTPGAGVQLAISVEPAGGSEQPTDEPIVAVVPSTV